MVYLKQVITCSISCILLAGIPSPASAFLWWGLNDREQQYCENVARRENTNFLAKKAYERCAKTVREVLGRRDKKNENYEKRKVQKEAERERQEALEKAAIAKLVTGMKQRCRVFQPQWRDLQAERGLNYHKYRAETKTFHPKMSSWYGSQYKFLFTNQKAGVTYNLYPEDVLGKFPWIKWYSKLLDKEREILMNVGGPGTTRNDPNEFDFRWLMDQKCSENSALSAAERVYNSRQ